MSLETDVRCLSAVRPFDRLPREALQMLAFSCKKRALRAGETLFAAGDPAEDAYLVLDGELVLGKDGEERSVGEGVLIGETALLVDTIRPAGATAATDSLLMRISGGTFRRVLSEFPESAAVLRRAAAERAGALISAMDRIRRRAFLAAV